MSSRYRKWMLASEGRLIAIALAGFWTYVIATKVFIRAVWLAQGKLPQLAGVGTYALQHGLMIPVLAVAYTLALRVAWRGDRWLRCLTLHVAIGVVVGLAARLALHASSILVDVWPGADLLKPFHALMMDISEGAFWLVTFIEFTFQYACGLGIAAAIVGWRRYHVQSQARQMQDLELTRARLSALRRQIDPHFLFNTLSSIAALVEQDPAAGNQMLLRFAALLRMTTRDDREQVTLGEEVEIARRYLELHAMRYPDRLRVTIVSDPDVERRPVPSLLLQPLVENAALYGLDSEHRVVDVLLRTRVAPRGATIIEIENTVAADTRLPDPRLSSGIGLRNTWSRLEATYGTAFEFRTERMGPERLRVVLELPAEVS
jgi:hypothetical protein